MGREAIYHLLQMTCRHEISGKGNMLTQLRCHQIGVDSALLHLDHSLFSLWISHHSDHIRWAGTQSLTWPHHYNNFIMHFSISFPSESLNSGQSCPVFHNISQRCIMLAMLATAALGHLCHMFKRNIIYSALCRF